jgi:hypothetical protein
MYSFSVFQSLNSQKNIIIDLVHFDDSGDISAENKDERVSYVWCINID